MWSIYCYMMVKYSLNWGIEIYLTILEREIFFPDRSCTIGIIVVNAEHKYHRTYFRQYTLLTSKDGQPECDCGRPRNRRKYWGSQEGAEFNMKVICKCWWRWTGSRMTDLQIWYLFFLWINICLLCSEMRSTYFGPPPIRDPNLTTYNWTTSISNSRIWN